MRGAGSVELINIAKGQDHLTCLLRPSEVVSCTLPQETSQLS